MSSFHNSQELDALARALEHSGESTIPADLRTRIIHALSQITSTLRTLQANSSQQSVSPFLHEFLPSVVRMFRATFAAHAHRSIARQALALLGLMCGVPDPRSGENYVLYQQVPACLNEMALLQRPDDVRPLLNAMLLVASGDAQPVTQWFRLWKSVEEHDKFVIALSAVLSGWQTQSKRNCEPWTPVQFLDIAEAVSIASLLRIEQLVEIDRKANFIRILTQTVSDGAKIVDNSNQQHYTLTTLAVSCGLLTCLQRGEVQNTEPDKRKLVSIVVKVIMNMQVEMQQFQEKFWQQRFASEQSDTISAILLVCTVMPVVSSQLHQNNSKPLRKCIEKLVNLGTNQSVTNKRSDTEFHQQTQWCVNSYSETLGLAYMTLVNEERCYVSFLRFLTSFVPANGSDASALRFIYTSAIECECRSLHAAFLLDILSLCADSSSSLENRIAEKFAEIIAPDMFAISVLVGTVTRDCSPIVKGSNRTNYLLYCISLTLKMRKTMKEYGFTRNFDDSIIIDHHEHIEVWRNLCRLLKNWITSTEVNTTIKRLSFYCLGAVVEANEDVTQEAKNEVINSVPGLLFQHYLFGKSGSRDQKRLLDAVRFVDSVSNTIVDRDVFQVFVDSLVQAAFEARQENSDEIGILLLRNAMKCREGVVDIALSGVSKLLKDDSDRKHRILPLAQAAVLGTDMIRKNVCIEWMLQTFDARDGNSQWEAKTRFTARGCNKLISAKL